MRKVRFRLLGLALIYSLVSGLPKGSNNDLESRIVVQLKSGCTTSHSLKDFIEKIPLTLSHLPLSSCSRNLSL